METELTEEDIAKDKAARHRQDMEDYHHAISGVDVGRRTGHGGIARRRVELAKEERARAFRDALDRMLQDPEYRALYEELGETLRAAEVEADAVLADLEAELRRLDRDVADMEARAAKGPDGKPVFRTADGHVVDANGNALPPEIAEGIIWPPGAPSAEAYFGAKDQRETVSDLLVQWSVYRNETLGGIRDRHSDRDKPMTMDEMRKALEDIEAQRPSLRTLDAVEPNNQAVASPAMAGASITVPMALN